MATIPFTPQAYAQIKADIARLQTERKAVIGRLQTAREMGDLSENGAYHYAKKELGDVSRQLRQLRYLLKEGQPVAASKHAQVEFGATVTLQGTRGAVTYQIVSEHESNPLEHKLSMTSPIGAALMGKKVGDAVVVETPGGRVTFTVEAIK